MDLRKLKEQLDIGEVDESTKNRLKLILEKSKTINVDVNNIESKLVKDNSEEIDKLIDDSVKTINKNDEELEKLSEIVNHKLLINKVKSDYEVSVNKLEIKLKELEYEFKEKYGDPEEYIKKNDLS
jgi:tetrahydrodipicolinate N-succinyltransferase